MLRSILRWLLLVSLLPVFIGLGVWETNLPMDPLMHKIALFLIIALVFGGAYEWVKHNEKEVLDLHTEWYDKTEEDLK